jgi:transposase-like protein
VRAGHAAGGGWVTAYIPNGRDRRRQAALEALDDGASPSEVGRRFGVARRTLRRWMALARRQACSGEARQGTLLPRGPGDG